MEPPKKAARSNVVDTVAAESDAERNKDRAPQRQARVLFKGCRHISEFEKLNAIDEGTYGAVFRYRDKTNGEIVALKKVKCDVGSQADGFPLTSLRESTILMQYKHENILDIREVAVGTNLRSVYLVMEFLEHDLRTLMSDMKGAFLSAEIKCLLQQLLRGVQFLHTNWILHRDLKTANLLMNNRGILKIGDFGLARAFGSPIRKMTTPVVTLWYRAPELLLGAKEYTPAIDMWSVGCIFAEFIKGEPLFPGEGEINQLYLLFSVLGTPTEETWPTLSTLPAMKKFSYKKHVGNKLRERLPPITNACFDLLSKLLTYDPAQRITAQEALEHPYFTESPLPQHPSMMPTFPSRAESADGNYSKKKKR